MTITQRSTMLRPYHASGQNQGLPLTFQHTDEGQTWKIQPRRIVRSVAFLCAVSLLSSDFIFDPIVEALSVGRKLCETYFVGDADGNDPYWENDYPAVNDYPGEPRMLPTGDHNIGFVITLTACPDDDSYARGVDTNYDPGHALYDAAAVLKHSILNNLAINGVWNATMHAIIHPDAIVCHNPNSGDYDRVKVLESLGYWVNIQASPLVNQVDIQSLYVEENLDTDTGARDLTSLYAANYDNHPAVIMTNLDTIIMDQPLDPVIEDFINDPEAKIAFPVTPVEPIATTGALLTPSPTSPGATAPPTTQPPTAAPLTAIPPGTTADMGLVLLKPDPNLVDNITDAYMNTPYDPVTGWNNTGTGAYNGSLGTTGILTHYYTNVAPESVRILDQCSYGNDHTGACLDAPQEQIAVAKISTCGAPWTCPDRSQLSVAEKAACDHFTKHWFEVRKDFEDNCWVTPNSQRASREGTYESAITLGFCNGTGITSYSRLIVDKPAPLSCDPDEQTNFVTSVLGPYNNGKFQNQKLTLTTGKHTGQSEICASGTVMKAGFEPPYNMAFVIDVSGSTSATFGGVAGDANFDGRSNTILDAEIKSVQAVLQHICTSADLSNDNVNVGLIKFSTDAVFLKDSNGNGVWPPCNPTNEAQVNPALNAKLVELRSNGWTAFDDALDKAIDFFQAAPQPPVEDRTNILFFLSDGIPNVAGDGDNEPYVSPTNNHPSALNYASELAILDSLNVARLGIGVGTGSDIAEGKGLWKIDNTPDEETNYGPQQVITTDALVEVLLQNPVVGHVIFFELRVNGVVDPQFSVDDVVPGPVGFTYGTFVVGGFNPFYGQNTTISVSVMVDYDGNAQTTTDQHSMTVQNTVTGALM